MRRRIGLVALGALVAWSCARPPPRDAGGGAAASGGEASRPEPTAEDGLEPMLPPLEKEDLAVGEGRAAEQGDRVRVHYRGTLLDGTVFDSSIDRGTPFEFTLGEGGVIPGWEIGVTGMQPGGKRRLRVPPHLAYGSTGAPPKIGPDATLLFEIELLEILPR
jgi:FKBP-type peptidyl-prolyl cis-trans isomerase